MRTIRAFFSKVAGLFTSPKAKQALDQAAQLTAEALPYIDIASKIIAGITPTTIDDAALAYIRTRYPQLFDGSIKDGEDLKLWAFGVAADLLGRKYPAISTSIARLAVQAAYTGDHA